MHSCAIDPLYFGGRLIACYVYMMLCADDDEVHVKIGMSQDPRQRALALFNNSPLVIEWMAVVDTPSREIARRIERGLHEAFAQWRTNGEWFKFNLSDKAEFNRIQQDVLSRFQSPSKKLKWVKVNVREMSKESLRRKRDAQRKWRTGSLAFRDALMAGLAR